MLRWMFNTCAVVNGISIFTSILFTLLSLLSPFFVGLGVEGVPGAAQIWFLIISVVVVFRFVQFIQPPSRLRRKNVSISVVFFVTLSPSNVVMRTLAVTVRVELFVTVHIAGIFRIDAHVVGNNNIITFDRSIHCFV
mmetsp:Transcript_12555/g.50478  ORF Transcript_12555/g.50478 Transcript_12555/m.50478 type:complete len:137 (-) Transcript_12555:326-736(-)